MTQKFIIEGLVEELQKTERAKDGGITVKYKAKIQTRGDGGDNVIHITSSEPINLAEGEIVQITAVQLQKTLDEFNGPIKVEKEN